MMRGPLLGLAAAARLPRTGPKTPADALTELLLAERRARAPVQGRGEAPLASHCFFFFGPDTVQSTCGFWGRTGAGAAAGSPAGCPCRCPVQGDSRKSPGRGSGWGA